MTPLLNAELLKLRTTRTFVALVASALALSLLLVVLASVFGNDLSKADVREIFTIDFTSLFIMLLGVMGMAGEWRHRTITASVLAAPDRLRLLAAKTLSYALAGAVLSLVVTLTIVIVGTLILEVRGETTLDTATLADVLWRNLLVAALLGAFGVCVGAVVRNQIAAMIGLLVFAFAIEPAVLALAEDVGRFGPTAGAPSGILDASPIEGTDLLAPGAAILVMLVWVAAGYAAGAWLLKRRDLT